MVQEGEGKTEYVGRRLLGAETQQLRLCAGLYAGILPLASPVRTVSYSNFPSKTSPTSGHKRKKESLKAQEYSSRFS
jgi:hypothetical protein